MSLEDFRSLSTEEWQLVAAVGMAPALETLAERSCRHGSGLWGWTRTKTCKHKVGLTQIAGGLLIASLLVLEMYPLAASYGLVGNRAGSTAAAAETPYFTDYTATSISGGSAIGTTISWSTRSALTPAQAQALVAEATPGLAVLNSSDKYHVSPSFVVDGISSNATVFELVGGDGVARTLIQMPGGLDNYAGRFEWIVDEMGVITHQLFVKGGSINGLPITP